MSTIPQLVPFQVPNVTLADTYTAMARLAAYDASRRSSLLEQEEKRGRLDREALWRQTIAGALQPPDQVPGQGFAAAQPLQAAAPPPAQGFVAAQPQSFTPTMAQQVPPATPEQGSYASLAPPNLPPASPIRYGTAPIDLQSRAGLEAVANSGAPGAGPQPGMPPPMAGMAQPVDTSQPPLQGGGFTVAPPGAPAPTQPGFTAPQPTRPLAASVPNLMPMPNAEAVQRAFAIDPEKTSQWYGAYLTQRGKQLDEVKRNNQLVYQVSSAILEHPDYYQEGLDYLREQGVPVPKNMPPMYDPALVKFHRDVSRERLDPLQEAQRENQLALAALNRDKLTTQERTREVLGTVGGLLQEPSAGGGTGAGGGAGASTGGGGRPPAESDATRAIRAEALRQGVDPDLAVAVATQESSLNPNAKGDGGRSLGYFQLQEGAAKDVGIDPARRHEPELNMRGGVAYLKQQLDKAGGDVDTALLRYNGGGDPNYVANVRRFLPARARGGPSTITASTNPDVQRLNQEIAKRQRIVEALALDPDMNTVADNQQKIIDRLITERNRLEPSPAELAKAREGELTRAQYERATKEEIDAINRTRPEGQKIPYGTTKADLRQQGLVGGEQVPQGVLDDLSARSSVVQQFEELSANVGALPTGPIAGRLEAIKQRFGLDVTDEKVAYRQILATAFNQLAAARSGMAINAAEFERLKAELPGPDDPPQVFKTRLATAARLARNIYKTKAQTYRKAGYALSDELMEPLANPEPPPPPTVTSNVDKFKAIKP